MPTRRQERASELIHEQISDLLQKRIRDPRLAHVTVTDVEISPDLRLATVFISTLGDRESCNSALEGLQHASSYIRRELAQRLQMRLMPELRFSLDDSWERGGRVDELLEQLRSTTLNDQPAKRASGDNGNKE